MLCCWRLQQLCFFPLPGKLIRKLSLWEVIAIHILNDTKRFVELMNNKYDYAVKNKNRQQFWHLSYSCLVSRTFNSFLFTTSFCVALWNYWQKPTPKAVNPMSKSPSATHYLSDKPWLLPLSFPLCCCCYRNHSAASSFKYEGLMFFSIHLLEALKSFFHHILSGLSVFFFFSLSLKTPAGLNCSNALSYELPSLSFIYWICCPIYFLWKINPKKSAGFHHPQRSWEI